MPTTKTNATAPIEKFIHIGAKEFRANMHKYSEQARKKGCSLLVMKKNKPIFEVKPLTPKEKFYQELEILAEKARKDLKEGKAYSSAQVLKIIRARKNKI